MKFKILKITSERSLTGSTEIEFVAVHETADFKSEMKIKIRNSEKSDQTLVKKCMEREYINKLEQEHQKKQQISVGDVL